MEIKNSSGAVIYQAEAEMLKALVEKAVNAKANLGGANLRDAYLGCADLGDANLWDANLWGAKINWNSHWLISEILWRVSEEMIDREQLAAWIGRKTDWCWEKFLALDHPCREWALNELAKWVQPEDGAPKILRNRQKEKLEAN